MTDKHKIPPSPHELLEKLKAKDDHWQEMCDSWIKQMADNGQPITQEQELILRETTELHAFNRITALTEALQTYDCGSKCSYLNGKYLMPDGRCPREHEGGCGRIAHNALHGYLPQVRDLPK